MKYEIKQSRTYGGAKTERNNDIKVEQRLIEYGEHSKMKKAIKL